MTVNELVEKLEEFMLHKEVVLEASGLGTNDCSPVFDVQEDYEGKVHIIAADGVKNRHET